MRIAAVLLLLLVLPACWGPRLFMPREHVAAVGPDGDPAALYVVAVTTDASQPARTGEVRIWSHGARALFTEDDREIVELYVGFELENNCDVPLRLDLASVTCEQLAIDGVVHGPLQPKAFSGDGEARPRTTTRVDVVFEPPAEAPQRIDGFSIRFVVRAGSDEAAREALVQVTPFGPYEPYDPYYHDPWGPYWGFGFGVGWSSHHCH